MSSGMDVTTILHELERACEAGSLPGRQSCEHNAALRELQRQFFDPPDLSKTRDQSKYR